jgi:hypothetical protein
MFKDCKTGGYHLEGSQASLDKLVRLMKVNCHRDDFGLDRWRKNRVFGKSTYICRPKEAGRIKRRHSKFWVGLSGRNWLVAFDSCQEWVEELINCVSTKKAFSQRKLRAITLIKQSL